MLLSALLLLATVALRAQASAKFEAFSNAKEVPLGGNFEVTFVLQNANGRDFSPPDFRNFTIVAGPSTSNSVQMINNEVTQETAISFVLQPQKVGTYRIDEASVKVNGRQMKTRPLTVKVVTAVSNAGSDDRELFVKVVPSTSEAYLGEQILVDFKLYTTVSLEGFEFLEEPVYRGFFAEEIRRHTFRPQLELVNGKQMTTKVLYRVALFPQQAGELTIPSTKLRLAVIDGDSRTNFFLNRTVRPINTSTAAVTIQVKQLPAGAPASFSGATGQLEMQASLTRQQATTDDAVSITMLISGDGDMKRIQAPELSLGDSFEVYPPKVIEEKTLEQQGRLMGKKIIEYLVLPLHPGEYSIAPTFSFLDTERGEYRTITRGPFPLRVTQGTDRHTSVRKPNDKVAVSQDIRFIKTDTELRQRGKQFVASPVFWALTSLPVLAFIGLFFFKKGKARMANIDPTELRSKHAGREAKKRLATARQHLDSGNSRAFYDEVSKASLGYVCDKLQIPLAELSKDNVQEKLRSLSVGQPLVDDLANVLQTCEMALFAGMDNAPAMQQTYEKAAAVITGIEKELSK